VRNQREHPEQESGVNRREIHLFDLDHTLLSCNASFSFGRFLYRRRVLSFGSMSCLTFHYLRHLVAGLPLPDLHKACFRHVFLGLSRTELSAYIERFLDETLDAMLFQPAVRRLQAAQKRHAFTAILSNSPDFLVSAIARRLGVDDSLGTHYEVDQNGCFNRISGFVQGKEKAAYLKLKENTIDGAPVFAYSDSILDLPFLEAAAIAVAVRPDRRLRSIGQKHGWEIVGKAGR